MNETHLILPFGGIPAVLYGVPSSQVWLCLHGKCGFKEEAASFAELAHIGRNAGHAHGAEHYEG